MLTTRGPSRAGVADRKGVDLRCTLWFLILNVAAVSKCGPVAFLKCTQLVKPSDAHACVSWKPRTVLKTGDVCEKSNIRDVFSPDTTSGTPAAAEHLMSPGAMHQMHGVNPPNPIKNEELDRKSPHPVLSLSVSRRNRTGKSSKFAESVLLVRKFRVFIMFHHQDHHFPASRRQYTCTADRSTRLVVPRF